MLIKSVNYISKNIEDILNEYDEVLKELLIETKIMLNDRWVLMSNKGVYYDNKVSALYPNLNKYKCNLNFYIKLLENLKIDYKDKLNYEGFEWDIPTKYEVKESFGVNSKNPFKLGNELKYDGEHKTSSISYKEKNTIKSYRIDTMYTSSLIEGIIMPIFRLKGENSSKLKAEEVLKLWLENNLIPEDTAYDNKYKTFIKLGQTYGFYTKNNKIKIKREEIIKDVKENKFNISLKSSSKNLIEILLTCDKTRADIEKYDEKILTDPNRGHWELYNEKSDEKFVLVELDKSLVARNPIADIKEGGIVAIDFGTKSTVVVHQEESEYTLPMRVGIGQFKKSIEEKHYENPTVMEFINLENFLNDYKKTTGRPNTKWEDLTISHTAFNSLLNSKSEDYYSYFSELKQWCSNKDRRVRLTDKNQNVFELPTFIELDDNHINPIEIYAYYLGLYINNMHNGIYLDYILSFPVTYEKEIKEKVVESFKKGIKKSLPKALHESEEIMDKFRVSIGASEPAAYAISALQEYGFEPEDDDRLFYGVFDFGGGTTDFDFGIYREANGKKEKRYDYVIEHFGAGGDRYLGGENILELLAFEVFKNNGDDLREKGITFVLPPECKKFPGSEILLSDSQEARLNTKCLMEKLRPLWEQHGGYEKIYSKGTIGINLYTNEGQVITNCSLNINQEELEGVIVNRIESGVKNFFNSLRIAFNNNKALSTSKVNIFLAGNSSKSQIVKDIFEKYIEKESENILSIVKSNDLYSEVACTIDELFELYPPLGTEEAYKKQEVLGLNVERDNLKKPTGKTGVAFGLIESRKGGSIKVVNENVIEDESKFKYYVGENKKKKFKYILSPEVKYNDWVEFIDAYEDDFEIYYTTLPQASTNKLDISQTTRIKCRIENTFEEDDVFVYVRASSPSTIEYVVAHEDEIKNEKYLSEIVKIQLD